jgi:predicted DNA-binding transcriptional regulator YafY
MWTVSASNAPEIDMYHPTSRVLTVLDVLQSRGTVRAADLAARLEVGLRTVRRYITMLQDIGIPVEGRPGRHGGYRLRPGFRLPPLMLANDEALAVTLGLLFARRFGLAGAVPATEGALAKVERVLPDALRAQVRALAEALILDWPRPPAPGDARPSPPPPATLLALAAAAAEGRRTVLAYRDRRGAATTRPFDPYAVVYPANGAWYAVGYCHLRRAVRVFRLDRVAAVEPEGTPFARPADLDCLAYVRRSLALLPAPWSAEVALDASLAEARRWAAPLFTVLTEEDGAVVMRCTVTDLDWLARLLAGLPFGFWVRTPLALCDALARVRDRLAQAIGGVPTPHASSR